MSYDGFAYGDGVETYEPKRTIERSRRKEKNEGDREKKNERKSSCERCCCCCSFCFELVRSYFCCFFCCHECGKTCSRTVKTCFRIVFWASIALLMSLFLSVAKYKYDPGSYGFTIGGEKWMIDAENDFITWFSKKYGEK